MSILETVMALSLFALVIVGVAASAGAGLRLTGQSNSRQAATQVATEAIELLRASEFTTLGMPSSTVYETSVAGSPDEDVDDTVSPKTFKVPLSNPITEVLVGGTTLPGGHKPPVVQLGARKFQVYQYVTDPAGANLEKRITVVVTYKDTSAGGGFDRVAFSSIVAPGAIAYGATSSTSSTTISSTSSTSTSSTSTTAPSGCLGDLIAPSPTRFEIAGGTGTGATEYVNSSSVQLKAHATDSCTPVQVAFSNDGSVYGALHPITSNPEVIGWTLTAGDGPKTVWFRFQDPNGNVATRTDTVNVDTVEPTAPSSFAGTASKNGSAFNASLSWKNDATDGGSPVISYEVFRRAGATGSFSSTGSVIVGTASGQCAFGAICSFVQTNLDGSTSYSYYVVAVDHAGNLSPATATLTCARPSGGPTGACS